MKKSVKKAVLLLSTVVMAATVMSFVASSNLKQDGDGDKWVVPESVKKMKNPTEGSDDDIKMGKTLYSKHCKSCHGSGGEGDGPKSSELDTPCGDFTTAEFQAQTDGELFYKTKEGRDDMPSFKKKFRYDEDVWLVVDYLRTLAAE